MGRLSRTKGQVFERAIAARMREVFPNARRGLQFRDGMECPDVEECPGWHLETKHHARLNVHAALRQAIHDAKPGSVPVVVAKANRTEPIVVMQFEDWLDLVKTVEELRQK